MTNKANENQIMSVHVNQVIESVIWFFYHLQQTFTQ